MKRTKGPWRIERYHNSLEIWPDPQGRAGVGTVIVGRTFFGGIEDAEVEPNMRLIAAAPEMLEACEAAHAMYSTGTPDTKGGWMSPTDEETLGMLKNAIAKAKGGVK